MPQMQPNTFTHALDLGAHKHANWALPCLSSCLQLKLICAGNFETDKNFLMRLLQYMLHKDRFWYWNFPTIYVWTRKWFWGRTCITKAKKRTCRYPFESPFLSFFPLTYTGLLHSLAFCFSLYVCSIFTISMVNKLSLGFFFSPVIALPQQQLTCMWRMLVNIEQNKKAEVVNSHQPYQFTSLACIKYARLHHSRCKFRRNSSRPGICNWSLRVIVMDRLCVASNYLF